jgi:hypothetical protein
LDRAYNSTKLKLIVINLGMYVHRAAVRYRNCDSFSSELVITESEDEKYLSNWPEGGIFLFDGEIFFLPNASCEESSAKSCRAADRFETEKLKKN